MSDISIEHLIKSYGAVDVLRDITLKVEEGEFIVLLGPSGCGKSTLLNAIAGLDEINSGSIHIRGRDVSKVEPSERGIAMVFQSYALYPTMSVRRNLTFGLRVAGVAKAEIALRLAWASKLLQIEGLLDRRPGALSGGQRQRVAIGRALVRRAAVYLFDEPLSNLDAKLRTETRIELKKLHAELGCTIVYVTHDQIEAMTLASRIAVMKGGAIVQCADPATIYERPSSLFVASFVGSPAMNFIPGRLETLAGRRIVDIGMAHLDVGAYAFAEPTADQDVIFGVRPEDLHVVADDRASFRGTVSFLEPMGADTLCWFKVGGKVVSARVAPAVARELHGVIGFGVDLTKISLFSAQTELRL
ncbi:ABC transporter ATP-binding protein [Acidisoma cladoniae]|jgi:multiple sugar transport system ATP-binding protein|uniref:ABC transporter ATP-binding protein n=1 Tax=Acidisoma cladoniae TaxID=3040935 RepID=UPI00254B2A29|nr:ABC transporter ATP-binding protein [Acidisoma sp. PAMC 29798]